MPPWQVLQRQKGPGKIGLKDMFKDMLANHNQL